MRRHIFIICFGLLAALLILGGCGRKEEPAPVGLVNPISTSSLEALEEETGHTVESFQRLPGLSVRRYNVEPVLFELEFTGEDSLEYTFRLTQSEELTDISGMYFTWVETIPEDGCTIYLDGQGHGICLWQAEGFAYSLAMEERASATALMAARFQLTKE